MQITKTNGGHEAFESPDGQFVYYAKWNALGIFKTSVDGGEETRVIDQVRMGHWAVTSQGICFLDMRSPAGAAVKFYDFATRRQRVMHQFPKQTTIGSETHRSPFLPTASGFSTRNWIRSAAI